MGDILGNEPIILPPQIWKMQLLKHLEIQRVVLADPPNSDIHRYVLKDVRTLLNLHNFKLTDDVIKRIPDLKKLKLTYVELSSNVKMTHYYLDNLSRLSKLESLSLSVCEMIIREYVSLPRSLKKLSLDGLKLPWEKMEIVGSLPNLEVLRLQNDAFCGTVWTPNEGEFRQLKCLHLRNMSLQQWEAVSSHFPRLERLIFYNLWRLKEIPLGMGDLLTLEFISIQLCGVSLIRSAKLVKKEQESWGNNDTQIHISRLTTMEQLPLILFWLPWLFLPEGPDLTFEIESHESPLTVEVENLEYDLRLLNAFLSYPTKKGIRDSEEQKELGGLIRDVMFESENICNEILMPINNEYIFLSDYCRRLLSIVKVIKYISARVQSILVPVANPDSAVNKEHCQLHRTPSIFSTSPEVSRPPDPGTKFSATSSA